MIDNEKIYRLFIYHKGHYIGAVYQDGYYVTQYGPYTLGEALRSAHIYDGLKRERAIVRNGITGEDVYKSILADI